MIRSCSGVTDHEEGKEEQAARTYGMQKIIEGPVQYKYLPPIKKCNETDKEGKANIELLHAGYDNYAQSDGSKKDDGPTAPLSGGKPGIIRNKDTGNNS